ncbi:MAG: fasciclin domain-containing protein [Bacteroidales bacterium]|nr:fasciclin domain-containing protein [Bacteroidales bacterium]
MKTRIVVLGLALAAFSFQSMAQCGGESGPTEAKNTKKTEQNIVQIASGLEDFSTLVAAVKAAGLAEILQGDGPFTVFAPTNASFEKLPAGTVESLLKPEAKDQLTKILTYHVVAGKFIAEDVIKAINDNNGSFSVETVAGEKLTASLSEGKVILTDSKGGKSTVSKTDVMASNGVIHVIDTVVMPK